MCKNCKQTVFSKADFARQLAHVPSDQRAYQNLKQFERGIRIMLPRFQKLLVALQYASWYPIFLESMLLIRIRQFRDPESPPTAAQLAEATKVRRRLTDSFTQYDVAARRIRDLPNPSSSPTQTRLQKQVYVQASHFLHLHMLPLKSIPKILKHAAPHGTHRHTLPNAQSHGRSASGLSITTTSSVNTINGNLAPNTLTNGRALLDDTSSQVSSSQQSDRESRLSSLESEEKAAREQLIVLEEQRFMVSEMLADAQRRRKFEEVASLGKNVDDLTRECDSAGVSWLG